MVSVATTLMTVTVWVRVEVEVMVLAEAKGRRGSSSAAERIEKRILEVVQNGFFEARRCLGYGFVCAYIFVWTFVGSGWRREVKMAGRSRSNGEISSNVRRGSQVKYGSSSDDLHQRDLDRRKMDEVPDAMFRGGRYLA